MLEENDVNILTEKTSMRPPKKKKKISSCKGKDGKTIKDPIKPKTDKVVTPNAKKPIAPPKSGKTLGNLGKDGKPITMPKKAPQEAKPKNYPSQKFTSFYGKKEVTEKEGMRVLKEKDGSYRWIAISSTAFRDDDGEIVSTKALQDDVDNSDLTGDYGTLRWWHVPNVDIGNCDFRMVAGQMLVESGKFFENKIGEYFKEAKEPLQMSIGFYHPVTEPDANGVYSKVKVFERSVMPAGCAANRFTKFISTKGA